MLNQLQPQEGRYQEGSSRLDIAPSALLANELRLEERDVKDWLQFAQKFSTLLHYYNDKDELDGFWNGFLNENLPESSDIFLVQEKEDSLRKFRESLARYLEGHLPINLSTELHQKLQSPHRVLFLTFLKLLEEIKEQFNQLPQRHLDFHYRNLLEFQTLPAIPDEVHVQVSLVLGAEQIILGPETEFAANSEDSKVVYRTDHLLPLNQINLEVVHQIYLEKKVESISEIRKNNYSDDDKGFLKLMEFTLGEEGAGTKLPKLPVVEGRLTGEESLKDFHVQFQEIVSERVGIEEAKPFWDYLQQVLFMTYDDFDYIMKTQKRSIEELVSYSQAWEKVYAILRRAYLTKDSFLRKNKLKLIFEAAESSEKGFLDILLYAFGKGDPITLPAYNNLAFDFGSLNEHLNKNSDETEYLKASVYLESELFIKPDEFKKIRNILYDTTKSSTDWNEALIILESAMREYRGIVATEPTKTHVGKLYTNSIDPQVFKKEENSYRSFPLLGDNKGPQAILGWQISSPLFILKEGRREISGFLRLDGPNPENLTSLLNNTISPNPLLNAYWLLDQENIPIETAHFSYGNFILDKPIEKKEHKEQENENRIVLESTTFKSSISAGHLILKSDGRLYEITDIPDSKSADLVLITQFSLEELENLGLEINENEFLLYRAEDIFYHSLKIYMDLSPDFPALTTTVENVWPSLILDLNEAYQPKKEDLDNWLGLENLLKNYRLDQVFIKAQVHDLEIKSVENDSYSLDAKSAFYPFGEPCEYGDSFYFTHDELAAKAISTLELKLEWPQVPQCFSVHYKDYYKYLAAADPSYENAAYKAKLSFKDQYQTVLIDENVPLFSLETSTTPEQHLITVDVQDQLSKNDPEYNYSYGKVISEGNPLNTNRYFILEYTGASFLQEEYQLAQIPFYTNLQREETPIVPTPLSKPYVPKLKKIAASYSSQEVLFPLSDGSKSDGQSTIAYRLPFGSKPIAINNLEEKPPLLCPYKNSGELYLGFSNVKPGDSLSILFQLVDGTAQINTEKPAIAWYYQSGSTWSLLNPKYELLDHTNGLTQTGIKVIQLPEDSNNLSKELPDDLFWMKIVAPNHSEGLPQFISILTGVGHAVLHSDAPREHYNQSLPVGSITEMEVYYPEIDKITQPFSSTKGRGQENPEEFYHRVSKRLRHKNRALTMWDYEQLILHRFPIVFKVKCLSVDHLRVESPGKIYIIVIADVRGQVPFTPLQPRLAEYELQHIKDAITPLSPPFAKLEVCNPDYLAIKVRLGVKLKAGYQPELSMAKLNQEIKQFLSPWAYHVEAEISFGGEVYANTLIGYIENLPYIDYISNIKLFHSDDGNLFTEVFEEHGFLKVVADNPKVVIVSAASHELDLINESGYAIEHFEGINFNKVELDFRVARE